MSRRSRGSMLTAHTLKGLPPLSVFDNFDRLPGATDSALVEPLGLAATTAAWKRARTCVCCPKGAVICADAARKGSPTNTSSDARIVTEDIVFSFHPKVWSFRRSIEFIAGLLFPLIALSALLAALAAQAVRLELPNVNEGDR
jgi:hypothetical protein